MGVIPQIEADAAEALKESSRQLEEAQRIAHLGHYVHDLDAGIIRMSEENYRILGLEPAEAISSEQGTKFLHPDDAAFVMEHYEEALRTGSFSLDYRIVRTDGEPRFVHGEGRVVFDDTGRARRMFGTIQDITERRRTEELLQAARQQADEARRQLLGEVMRAREEERAALARELHDEVGQQVTALLLGLQVLSRAGSVAESRPQAGKLREVAAATVESLRRLAHGLHPLALDQFGIASAIELAAREYTTVFGIPVQVDVETFRQVRLPKAVEIALYRMCKEALTNVARHTEATGAWVSLRLEGADVMIEVRDDGAGFDAGEVLDSGNPARAFGLRGILESAGLLGGAARIDSAPGRGTTIRVTIPYAFAV